MVILAPGNEHQDKSKINIELVWIAVLRFDLTANRIYKYVSNSESNLQTWIKEVE